MVPTGNYRLRVETRFLRAPVLVLQMEFAGQMTTANGPYIEQTDITQWQDAKVEDLGPLKSLLL